MTAGDEVTIKPDELKALFDMAANSMDFGSGFLDTDDVVLLRRIAVMIGVDPMVGTPSEFATQYPHAWKKPVSALLQGVGSCDHCRRVEGDPIHAVEVSQ